MNCQIINEENEPETVTAYVNLCDEDSFHALSDFLDGIGDYRLEEIAT